MAHSRPELPFSFCLPCAPERLGLSYKSSCCVEVTPVALLWLCSRSASFGPSGTVQARRRGSTDALEHSIVHVAVSGGSWDQLFWGPPGHLRSLLCMLFHLSERLRSSSVWLWAPALQVLPGGYLLQLLHNIAQHRQDMANGSQMHGPPRS